MADVAASAVPEVPARLVFMGGRAAEGRARVVERSKAWRRSQVTKDLALLLLAPVAALIPPHFPWVIVVIAVAVLRAFNHSREHRTLLSLRGPCPKCGAEQEFTEVGRMGSPHKVTCASCRWDVFVEIPRAGAAT